MEKRFNEKLIGLLKKDLRFVDDETGELIRNEIINEALKIDEELISLLLEDKEVKQKFFSEIKGHWVFNINNFIDYVQDKELLMYIFQEWYMWLFLNVCVLVLIA